MPSSTNLTRGCSLRSLAACIAAAFGIVDAVSADRPTAPQGSIVVTNCDDSGPGSLRASVDAAGTNDPVDLTHLPCSTITLTSGAIHISRKLTLIGPGSGDLTVDGNHDDAVFVDESTNGTLTIQGMTVQNGYRVNVNGGCIYARASLVLDDTIVTGCKAAAHGTVPGTYATGGGLTTLGSLTATNSHIDGNEVYLTYAQGTGGGAVAVGSATLTDSTISGNTMREVGSLNYPLETSVYGGGLFCQNDVSLVRSSIDNNTARSSTIAYGGGIWSARTLSMSYSTVSNNKAYGRSRGGGILLRHAFTIDHSTVSGNVTDGPNGAISAANDSADYSTITSSTISGNHATIAAGVTVSADIRVANSTIVFNVEAGAECAALCVYGHAQIDSSIVASNTGSSGSRLNIGPASAASVSGTNDLIGESDGVDLPPDVIQSDPMLAALADNGGWTLTHALLPGSPAIDTGSDPDQGEWDQRGEGYPRVIGVAADIGAFEAPPPNQSPHAVDDSYVTLANIPLTVSAPGVLGNDIDPDGDTLSAVLVSDVSNGALTLNADGSFIYVPATNFIGTDSFNYKANDGQADSDIATVTIELIADPHDPIFSSGFD